MQIAHKHTINTEDMAVYMSCHDLWTFTSGRSVSVLLLYVFIYISSCVFRRVSSSGRPPIDAAICLSWERFGYEMSQVPCPDPYSWDNGAPICCGTVNEPTINLSPCVPAPLTQMATWTKSKKKSHVADANSSWRPFDPTIVVDVVWFRQLGMYGWFQSFTLLRCGAGDGCLRIPGQRE